MNILALSGGVGGAKLALGLSKVVSADQLSIVVNTADDFEHLGLYISPDIDSVLYSLAQINNTELGWGVQGETWSFMSALEEHGGPTWFRLGDKDLATHVLRNQYLSSGKSLSEATCLLGKGLGLSHAVLPMCNEKVSTYVNSSEGRLPFQQYFVARQCEPEVYGVEFDGVEVARITDELDKAIDGADAIIICPSNPFVSIEPILSIPGLREKLIQRNIPIVVVSPIVGGKAIKGPAAKMMQELNMPSTSLAVAQYYQGFATHFVIDSVDSDQALDVENLGVKSLVCNTVMHDLNDKKRLAEDVLEFIR